METVITIGIQGSGKTTFYRERFFDTHLRLSLDMLKTRHRLRLLIEACVGAKQPFVVDNTNVLRKEREEIIRIARAGGFSVKGYFFEPHVKRAIVWNKKRTGRGLIPMQGLLGTLKRMQRPELEEEFDELFNVRVNRAGEFIIEEWTGSRK